MKRKRLFILLLIIFITAILEKYTNREYFWKLCKNAGRSFASAFQRNEEVFKRENDSATCSKQRERGHQ